jgi:integrase
MENLEFKIQLKGSQGNQLAFIITYHKAFKSHRFIWSTGITVKARGFDPARPGSVLKRKIKDAEEAYASLIRDGHTINNDSLKNRIELIRDRISWADNELHIWDGSAVQYFQIPESTDRETLKSQLQKELTKQKPDFKKVIDSILTDGQNGLFGFWSGIIEGKIKPRHGKPLRDSSKSVKRQAFRTVKEFDPLASFEKMDMAWYNAFVRWMDDQTVKTTLPDGTTETRKRFDTNTVGKHVRQLKAVLHLAYRNELMQHDRFKYWPVSKESNEVIALSKDELLKINKLELTGTKDDVRDIFILAAFTGPRISDFKMFEKASLSTNAGVTFFSYVQEKTGARVKIPVHPIAQEILNKRGGDFPRMISEQNFRLYLKEICQAAELNDRVIVKIRDGKPQYKKKFEAISPHSARRTFASSLFYGWFSKPMPASFCMRYTGHKTEKSFMLYIGASEKDLDAKALEYFDFKPVMKAS